MSPSAPLVRLAEVASVNPPLADIPGPGERVDFVPMAAVDEESLTVRPVERRVYAEVCKGYTPFQNGDLLVAKITPCFENGKIVQADLASRWAVGSTEFHVIRPNTGKVDARYLLHFLRQARVRREGQMKMTGSAGQRRVPAHFLTALRILLPALERQRHVASILDTATALRAKRRAGLAKLDALTQSFFLDMFGDPGANPKGWTISTIGNLAEVGTGGTPSRSVGANFGGQMPWVKTTEVNWRVIERTEEHLTELGFRSSRSRLFPRGSVLVALYGQGKTRGKSAILGLDATTNQACGVVLPSPRHDPLFLMHSLKLSYQRLRDLGRGGNQENLNLGILASFAIPLPPIEIQRAFAERIGFVERLARGQQRSLTELDALFASLQHRAFNGDL